MAQSHAQRTSRPALTGCKLPTSGRVGRSPSDGSAGHAPHAPPPPVKGCSARRWVVNATIPTARAFLMAWMGAMDGWRATHLVVVWERGAPMHSAVMCETAER